MTILSNDLACLFCDLTATEHDEYDRLRRKCKSGRGTAADLARYHELGARHDSQPSVLSFSDAKEKSRVMSHEALFMIANRGLREALDLVRPWFDYTSEDHATPIARQVAASLRLLLAKLTYDASKTFGKAQGNHVALTPEDLAYIRSLLAAEVDADSESRHLQRQAPEGLITRFGRLL